MDTEGFNFQMTASELILDTNMSRPHVVILGAGASKAAFPEGDRNGKPIPLMDSLISIIGLSDELELCGIDYKGKNFEEIYSELSDNSNNTDVVTSVENKIWDYFNTLELPPYPTLYDHLVLSLREKDIIATFNWDPFLFHACWRNHTKANLPHVVYLHGNVSIGYCLDDNKVGLIDSNCNICGRPYIPSKLLFPVENKVYNLDPFIKREWETLNIFLKKAYMLTVFGYSAPTSDVAAKEIMKKAWGSVWSRNLEQTEIIDTKSEDMLKLTWADFIHTHHYDTTNNFYNSSLGLFPRRSCEAQWNSTMEGKFLEQFPIPTDSGFEELWSWFSPLVKAEIDKQE